MGSASEVLTGVKRAAVNLAGIPHEEVHRGQELALAEEALYRTQKELEDRTAWARSLDEEKRQLEQQIACVRASRWMRISQKLGLGPAIRK